MMINWRKCHFSRTDTMVQGLDQTDNWKVISLGSLSIVVLYVYENQLSLLPFQCIFRFKAGRDTIELGQQTKQVNVILMRLLDNIIYILYSKPSFTTIKCHSLFSKQLKYIARNVTFFTIVQNIILFKTLNQNIRYYVSISSS